MNLFLALLSGGLFVLLLRLLMDVVGDGLGFIGVLAGSI